MGRRDMSDIVMRKLELGLIPVINFRCYVGPEGDSLPNILNPPVKQIIDSEQRRRILSSYPSAHG
jgi:hypothetical protein